MLSNPPAVFVILSRVLDTVLLHYGMPDSSACIERSIPAYVGNYNGNSMREIIDRDILPTTVFPQEQGRAQFPIDSSERSFWVNVDFVSKKT